MFLFDKSVESGPGKYENASFKDLYQGYADQFKGDALLKRADQLFADLNESKDLATNKFLSVKLQRKGASSVRTAFDNQGDSSRELSEFQMKENLISDAEREGNATSAQLENKESLDRKIEEIRNQQSVLNRKRSLAVRLIDSCSSLDQNAKWEELERTDGEVLFARRLELIYSILPKEQASEKVDQRVAELEFSRAEKARGHLVQNLIDRQLNR